MFSGLVTRPLILTLLVSLSLNGLFGYLSYNFYGKKEKAEASLEVALDANKSLSESSEKADKTCKLGDTISSEYKREEQALEGGIDDVVRQIDILSSKKETNVAKEATAYAKDNVASLSDQLPSDIQRVLSESCSKVRGEACPHP